MVNQKGTEVELHTTNVAIGVFTIVAGSLIVAGVMGYISQYNAVDQLATQMKTMREALRHKAEAALVDEKFGRRDDRIASNTGRIARNTVSINRLTDNNRKKSAWHIPYRHGYQVPPVVWLASNHRMRLWMHEY